MNEPAATPAPTQSPTPEPQGGPLGPATGPERTVASGEFEGEPWELFARSHVEGICYEVRLGGPNVRATRGSCDPYEGMPMAGAVSVVVEGGPTIPTIVFGVVRKEAAVVRVEFPDGTVHDVSPSGQDAGFAVNFYALVVPPAGAPSVDVRAYDDAGNELGPPPEPLGPEPAGPQAGAAPLGLEPTTGSVELLARGEIDGLEWEFIAHPWQDGICYGFLEGEPEPVGAGAWCEGDNPLELSPGNVAGVATNTGAGQGQPSFVYGPVRKDATLVRVELPNGEVNEVEPVGQQAGLAVNFYVQPYATDTNVDSAQVTAYDAAGQPID